LSKFTVVLFTTKIFANLSKTWVWDPGSGKKNYSGSWIRGSKRHRMPDPDPQHWLKYLTTRIKTGKNVLPPRRNGAPRPPA
jgi:hypothetical protein